MQDGQKILNELEFEQHIAKLTDRGLIEFVARQQYDMSRICPIHDERLRKLEKRRRRELASSGGAGALITALVLGLIEYFRRG